MNQRRFVRACGQTNLDRFVEALARCCARRALDEAAENRRRRWREGGGRTGDDPLHSVGRGAK